MRKETRAGKLGRFLAAEYDGKMAKIPKGERDEYIARFINELIDYSFQKVKKGQKGIRKDRELEELAWPDVKNPLVSARILKEYHHHLFQTNTSYNHMRGFLYHFQEGVFRSMLDKMQHLPNRHKNCKSDEYVYSDYPNSV